MFVKNAVKNTLSQITDDMCDAYRIFNALIDEIGVVKQYENSETTTPSLREVVSEKINDLQVILKQNQIILDKNLEIIAEITDKKKELEDLKQQMLGTETQLKEVGAENKVVEQRIDELRKCIKTFKITTGTNFDFSNEDIVGFFFSVDSFRNFSFQRKSDVDIWDLMKDFQGKQLGFSSDPVKNENAG